MEIAKQNITLEELLKTNNITPEKGEIDALLKEVSHLINNNKVEVDVFHNTPVVKIQFLFNLTCPHIPSAIFKEYLQKTHVPTDSYIHVECSITPMPKQNECLIKIYIFNFF